jgi:importin-5
VLEVSCRTRLQFASTALLKFLLRNRLLPVLLDCGKMSNTLTTQMVSTSAAQLIHCIDSETEPSGLVPLFKCFVTFLAVIGGPTALPQELHDVLIQVVKRRLQNIAEERKARTQGPASEIADGLLCEIHIETFALMQMGRLLHCLDPTDPLVVEVWKVLSIGLRTGTPPADISNESEL